MSNKLIPEPLREQLARLDAKRQTFSGLSAPALESLLGRLRVELTYSSNAIEGNTLSLRETQLVVEEKLTPGQGKTLREIYEARNHYAAVKEVERFVAEKGDVSSRAILDLHQMVMRDIDAAWGGRLRNGPGFIKGTRHSPPNAAHVGKNWMRFYPGRGKARCIRCSWRPKHIFVLNPCIRSLMATVAPDGCS